jgi:hypothetical protein
MKHTLMNFNAACVCKKLNEAIYEISIREISRLGIQEFFQHLTLIYTEALAAEVLPVRTLVHVPAGSALPIVSTASELQKWSAQFGSVPARCAVIYDGAFGSLIDTLARNAGYRAEVLRVFKSQQPDEAVQWLMQSAASPIPATQQTVFTEK